MFGPGADGAQVEGSKAYMKQLAVDAGCKAVFITDEAGAAASNLPNMATIVLPVVDEIIAPMIFSMPIQLLAYYVAVQPRCNSCGKQRRRRAVDRAIAAASHLMQGAERQSPVWQTAVDLLDPE